MFQFLGETIGAALIAIIGWFAFSKAKRLVGHDGSPREIHKRVRYMKFCGVNLMLCGGIMLIFLLARRFVRS